MTSTKSRIIQYILIILVTAAAGGGYWYWKNANAAGTVSTNRPSFEAPLTTDLNLTAGQGIATYSRADGVDRRATVTDFEGLIRPVKQNEARFDGARRVENLVSYSEALDNGVWSKQAGDLISANVATAPDDTFTADKLVENTNNSYHNIYNAVSKPAESRIYAFSVYVKPAGRSWIRQVLSGGTNYIQIYFNASNGSFGSTGVSGSGFTLLSYGSAAEANGYYRLYMLVSSDASTNITLNMFLATGNSSGQYVGDGSSGVYYWGAQLEEVTGQANQNPSEYISMNVKTAFPYHGAGVDGVKYFSTRNGNTVASNVVTEATGAAIPTATLRGYLAEGNQTNLLLQSESFDNASWLLTGNNATVTANAVVAPSGLTTAEKLVEDTATGRHQIYQNYTLTAVTHSVSIYAKAGERTRFEIYIPGTNLKGVGFDLSSVATFATTVAGVSAPTSSSIVSVGNGWYRCQMAWTAVAEATNIRFALNNGTTADSYTGTSGNGLYLWGAQLEQAPFASSYIPTTTASVTRATDKLRYVGVSNFNNTAGTVTADVTTEWIGGVGTDAYFIDDSSVYQRMSMWHWGGASNCLEVDRNGGGGTRNNYDYSSSTITSGTLMKLGHRWSSSANSLFRDGSLRGSDTTLTLPYDSISGISVGIRADNNTFAYSNLKNVRAWKKALTDTELRNLTSLTNAVATSGVKKTILKNTPSDTGLVGYWSFDDGSGTKAEDSSPAGTNTGTLTNGPTWVDGKLGKAVNFDGVNDYVNAGSNTSLALTDNFTLSAWINPSSLHTVGYSGLKNVFLYRGDYSSTWINYLLQIESDTSITFKKRLNSESIISYTFTGVPSLTGKWSHITLTVLSNTATLYVNGTKISALSIAALDGTYTAENLFFGTCIPGGSSEIFFTGKIDESRIYNRALSQAEITALYGTTAAKVNVNQNSQLTNGLVGLWSFNGQDVSGTTAYDRSGQGNNGTLTNGPTVYPGKVGQALSFNGTNSYVNIGNPATYDITGPITVSAWVKVNNFKSVGSMLSDPIIGKWAYAVGNHRGYDLRFFSGDTRPIFVVADGVNYDSVQPAVGISTGVWTHIVGVWYSGGSNNFQIYVNGTVTQKTNAYASLGVSPNALHIGNNYVNAAYFDGVIDEVRIYNRALSATEVTALYNLGR